MNLEAVIKTTKEFEEKTKKDLKFFTYNIYSDSFRNEKKKFTGGDYPDEILDYYQKYDRTMVEAPRKNFKSEGLHASLAWDLWRLKPDEVVRWFYFSYNDPLAMERVQDFKDKIKINRFFSRIKDLKPTAESIVKFTWNGNNKFSIIPRSIGSFKRGSHDNTICDDILCDPKNKLSLTEVKYVNKVFMEEIYHIPMKWHKFRIVGTAQTNDDFFSDKHYQKEFNSRHYKSIINEAEKKVLWEQWETFEELKYMRQGDDLEPDLESDRYRSFQKEKMGMPHYSADAYLSELKLRKRVNKNLINLQFMPLFVLDDKFEKVFEDKNIIEIKKLFNEHNIKFKRTDVYDYSRKWEVDKYIIKLTEDVNKGEFYLKVYEKRETMNDVVAGIDIGKLVHPGFYTVFEKVDGRWIQIHLCWMHHWDYKDQVDYINLGRDLLDVDYTYYDNTRGEYTGFVEKGDLDSGFIPVNFGSKDAKGGKIKYSLAAQLNVKLIETDGAELLNDETQLRVMLTVDKDLIAVETNIDGRKYHGDSFWGNALAIGGGEVMTKFSFII